MVLDMMAHDVTQNDVDAVYQTNIGFPLAPAAYA